MTGTSMQAAIAGFMTVRFDSPDAASTEKTSDDSFSKVMEKTTANNSFKTEVNKETEVKDDSIKKELEKTKEFVKKIKEVDEANGGSGEEAAEPAMIMMTVQRTVDYVKEFVAEQLGIPVEELEVDEFKLFDPNTISKLVVETNNLTDVQELLVDDAAMAQFKNIMAEIEAIETELNNQGIEVTDSGFANMETGELIVIDDTEGMEEELKPVKLETNTAEGNGETPEENIAVKEQAPSDNANNNMAKDEGSSQNETRSSKEVVADENVAGTRMNPLENLQQVLSEKVGKTQSESIMTQIQEQVKLHINSEFKSMEMQLYPEHLGKVGIQIVSREGGITAQISAETEAVRKILETQIATLRENLTNQGLKIENVEVTIASHSFEQNNMNDGEKDNQSKGNKKNKKIDSALLDEINGITAEEQNEQEVMRALGNTVSYSA